MTGLRAALTKLVVACWFGTVCFLAAVLSVGPRVSLTTPENTSAAHADTLVGASLALFVWETLTVQDPLIA